MSLEIAKLDANATLLIALSISITINCFFVVKFFFIKIGKVNIGNININYGKDEVRKNLKKKSQALKKEAQKWKKILINLQNKPNDHVENILTGFIELDNATNGFKKSQLISIVGLSGVGKTTFALDIIRKNAIEKNILTLFFSQTTKAEIIIDRLIGAQSGVDSYYLQRGEIKHSDDFNRISDSLDTLAKAPIFIDDTYHESLDDIEHKVSSLKEELNDALIIIDDINLISEKEKRHNLLSRLKKLASDTNFTIIILSHIDSERVYSRGGNVRLSDLEREFAYIVDLIIGINENRWRDYNYPGESPVKEIEILKNKNGATGKFELYHDQRSLTFRDLTEQDKEASSLDSF